MAGMARYPNVGVNLGGVQVPTVPMPEESLECKCLENAEFKSPKIEETLRDLKSNVKCRIWYFSALTNIQCNFKSWPIMMRTKRVAGDQRMTLGTCSGGSIDVSWGNNGRSKQNLVPRDAPSLSDSQPTSASQHRMHATTRRRCQSLCDVTPSSVICALTSLRTPCCCRQPLAPKQTTRSVVAQPPDATYILNAPNQTSGLRI